MDRRLQRDRRKSRHSRLPSESAKCRPSCPWRDLSQSSFPCSRVREQRLPDCFFQVCAFSLFLLGKEYSLPQFPAEREIRRSDRRKIPIAPTVLPGSRKLPKGCSSTAHPRQIKKDGLMTDLPPSSSCYQRSCTSGRIFLS